MVCIKKFSQQEFVADSGITGFEKAVVREDDHGAVKFWRIPQGWNIGQLGVQENLHVHRNVYEYAAILSGRLPHIEYDLERRERTQIEFAPGQLMIRPSGSIHGLDDSLTVPETCQMLYWNTGSGTSLGDPDYQQETADLLGERLAEGFAHDGVCRVLSILDDDALVNGKQWLDYSLPGEPMLIRLCALAPDQTLEIDELLSSQSLFGFLWDGSCQIAGAKDQTSVTLEKWTILTDPQRGADKRVIRAITPAIWLCVDQAE